MLPWCVSDSAFHLQYGVASKGQDLERYHLQTLLELCLKPHRTKHKHKHWHSRLHSSPWYRVSHGGGLPSYSTRYPFLIARHLGHIFILSLFLSISYWGKKYGAQVKSGPTENAERRNLSESSHKFSLNLCFEWSETPVHGFFQGLDSFSVAVNWAAQRKTACPACLRDYHVPKSEKVGTQGSRLSFACNIGGCRASFAPCSRSRVDFVHSGVQCAFAGWASSSSVTTTSRLREVRTEILGPALLARFFCRGTV